MRRTLDGTPVLPHFVSVEAITISFNRKFVDLREVVEKRVLSNVCGWATILFVYRERRSTSDEFGDVRFALEKWVRRDELWFRNSSVKLRIDTFWMLKEIAEEYIELVDDEDKADGSEGPGLAATG